LHEQRIATEPNTKPKEENFIGENLTTYRIHRHRASASHANKCAFPNRPKDDPEVAPPRCRVPDQTFPNPLDSF
jgi:hypothetical protein